VPCLSMHKWGGLATEEHPVGWGPAGSLGPDLYGWQYAWQAWINSCYDKLLWRLP
jgi:hypothetical protein